MFMPIGEFKARMETLIKDIKNSTLMEGIERVYVPGHIEYENRERALKEGIPLPPPWQRWKSSGNRRE